jgi:hypothetical protein
MESRSAPVLLVPMALAITVLQYQYAGMIFCFSGNTVYFEIETVYIAPLFFVGKVKICSVIQQKLFAESCFVIFVSVWPKMEPNELQCIG